MEASTGPQLRLICLPYAGGSSFIFRDWDGLLPPGVEVSAWELRGRGRRFSEAPHTRIKDVVGEVAEDVACGAAPFALYGHSMGGILAFEVARELRRRGTPAPRALFVAAASAPQRTAVPSAYHRLPDRDLIERLRKFNGTPQVLFDNPELLRACLPVMRADFQLVETYCYQPEPPLECPIVAFGGLRDRVVDRGLLPGWEEQTSAGFSLEWLAGDHFFPATARTVFLWLLAQAIERILGGEGPLAAARARA